LGNSQSEGCNTTISNRTTVTGGVATYEMRVHTLARGNEDEEMPLHRLDRWIELICQWELPANHAVMATFDNLGWVG